MNIQMVKNVTFNGCRQCGWKQETYISVEFGERVVHIKSVHVNNGSIYCELRTDF